MTKINSDRGYRDLTADPVVLKDGTILTEERAADWDREIEQRLKPGRPPIDPDTHSDRDADRRSPQVSARVPRALLTKLQQRAEAEGKATSEVVREALQAYVA